MDQFNFPPIFNPQAALPQPSVETLELPDLFRNPIVRDLYNNYQSASKKAVDALQATNDAHSARTQLLEENFRLKQELENLRAESQNFRSVRLPQLFNTQL